MARSTTRWSDALRLPSARVAPAPRAVAGQRRRARVRSDGRRGSPCRSGPGACVSLAARGDPVAATSAPRGRRSGTGGTRCRRGRARRRAPSERHRPSDPQPVAPARDDACSPSGLVEAEPWRFRGRKWVDERLEEISVASAHGGGRCGVANAEAPPTARRHRAGSALMSSGVAGEPRTRLLAGRRVSSTTMSYTMS